MPGSCSTACGLGPETIGTSSRFCCECGLTKLSMRFLHNGANSLPYGADLGAAWIKTDVDGNRCASPNTLELILQTAAQWILP